MIASRDTKWVVLVFGGLAASVVGLLVLSHHDDGPDHRSDVAFATGVVSDEVKEGIVASDTPMVPPPEDISARSTPNALSAAGDEAVDYRDPLYRASVIGGTVSREQFGAGYDEMIKGIAGQRILSSIEGSVETNASMFCGFREAHLRQSSLEQIRAEFPLAADELDRLYVDALDLAGRVPEFVDSSWRRGAGLIVFDPSMERPDSFLQSRPKGLYEFSSSSRIGDRVFVLEFTSADHPQLELELEFIKARRELIWKDIRR